MRTIFNFWQSTLFDARNPYVTLYSPNVHVLSSDAFDYYLDNNGQTRIINKDDGTCMYVVRIHKMIVERLLPNQMPIRVECSEW